MCISAINEKRVIYDPIVDLVFPLIDASEIANYGKMTIMDGK